MRKRQPGVAEIGAMRENGDVTGLIESYEATKRRDRRKAILAALAGLGDAGRSILLDLLGDETWQRSAGGVLVELSEETFPTIAAQLGAVEQVRRRGALHTVYLYARYRDLPAARELLVSIGAAGDPDLAEAAVQMAEKVELTSRARNEEIDRQLARIKASIDQERAHGEHTILRMYSGLHRGRMEARQNIVALRYAGIRHVIAVAPQYGEATLGVLLALGLDELGGSVVPIIEESLASGDPRARSLLITTLLCLYRARVPGAGDALERCGVTITDTLNRRAAHYYKRWVREG